MISRVWSSCLESSQSRLDPRKRTQRAPRSRTLLPALPKQEQQAKGNTINHVQCSSNMMQTWYDMRDAICDAYARFDKELLNLASTWNPRVPLER